MISPLPRGWTYMGGVAAHQARARGNWQSDNAIDMGASPGTPVYAVEGGMVDAGAGFGFRAVRPYIWGYRLTLDGISGDSYFYTHLGSFARGIAPGTRVIEGRVIGWIGSPPWFPPHLHFAARDGDPERIARLTTEEGLRARSGFLAWAYWFLGIHAWRGFGPRNPTVRPDVPARIPARWWRRLAMFVAARR